MIISRKIHKFIVVILIFIIFASCDKTVVNNDKVVANNHSLLGEEVLKEELENFLNDSSQNLLRGEILIKDKQTLISIAEPILFNIYGKENIKREQPYEIYLFGDNWVISGTLPENSVGGTFIFSINRKTCEVVGISHGK